MATASASIQGRGGQAGSLFLLLALIVCLPPRTYATTRRRDPEAVADEAPRRRRVAGSGRCLTPPAVVQTPHRQLLKGLLP
ncbi:unnamed protein product [Urochloa humidicola]